MKSYVTCEVFPIKVLQLFDDNNAIGSLLDICVAGSLLKMLEFADGYLGYCSLIKLEDVDELCC